MSERLTLVIFKDHLSSRTLTVRLAWLRTFGFVLLSVIGLAIVSAALFFNAYRRTISTGSVATTIRVEELEKELAETKSAYEAVKTQALSGANGGSVLAGATQSFALLPAESMLEKPPAPETLPFRLESLKAQWKGSTLQIRSAIEYSKEDGGNQQGHFIILVRGPQSVSAYPDGSFDATGTAALVKPDSGEYFSVSRYREIKADFGPFAHRDDVRSIEILIFDSKRRLIFVNRTGLESARAASPKESETSATKEKGKEKEVPATTVETPKKATAPKPAPKATTAAPAAPAAETAPANTATPGTPAGASPTEAPAAPAENGAPAQ